MEAVRAQNDLGPMSTLTRLLPRRVSCLPASGGPLECVVKYRRERLVACCLISEVVGACVLHLAGVPCVQPRVVTADAEFAGRCNSTGEIPYVIHEGNHFGTVYQRGEGGPVLRLAHLASPQQVVDLWVVDCWLCTVDRRNEGNTLLVHKGGGKFDLYAVDQSDCFGGPAGLADGTYRRVMDTRNRVEDAGCLSEAILECGGPSAVRAALGRADAAHARLGEVWQEVPREWWGLAGLDPGEMHEALDRRYRRLRGIVDPDGWPGPGGFSGAVLLG